MTEPEAFAALIDRHRSELHRHCARLLACPADAEDALLDALLRAWRARHTLATASSRAWLYRIATNACFDVRARRVPALTSLEDDPVDAAAPRDVLSWSARETATALSTSVPATNSALQRARATVRARYVAVPA